MTSFTSSDKLTEVREAFDYWRKTRIKRQPIPDKLWQMAIDLLNDYPISHIKRELRLNLTQLRKRQRALKKVESLENNPMEESSFIELNRFLPNTSASSSVESSAVELRIERADGSRLILFLNSSQTNMIQHLVTAFIRV